MDLELAGKVVLITGGTDGLGLGLALRLAAEGASVAVCGRDEERLHAAETALRQAGADVLAQRADVARAQPTSRRSSTPPPPVGIASTGWCTTPAVLPPAPSMFSTTPPGTRTSS